MKCANMGYMDKQPSRIQGQIYFLKSGGVGSIFGQDPKFLDLFGGGCPEVPDHGPRPLSTSP